MPESHLHPDSKRQKWIKKRDIALEHGASEETIAALKWDHYGHRSIKNVAEPPSNPAWAEFLPSSSWAQKLIASEMASRHEQKIKEETKWRKFKDFDYPVEFVKLDPLAPSSAPLNISGAPAYTVPIKQYHTQARNCGKTAAIAALLEDPVLPTPEILSELMWTAKFHNPNLGVPHDSNTYRSWATNNA